CSFYNLCFQAEDGIRYRNVTGVQTCALPISPDTAIASNPAWQAHYEETKDVVKEATSEDLEWADAIIFSTATRFGAMASQMKQFLDMQGGLRSEERRVGKECRSRWRKEQ